MKILNLKPTLEVVERKESRNSQVELVCTVIYKGKIPKDIINPDGRLRVSMSFLDTKNNRILIERLKKALSAGVIYNNPVIEQGGGVFDFEPGGSRFVKPFKYLTCKSHLIPKYLEQDLMKLGF